MKILIAEDDNVSRRMLQRTLEKWGYQVISTTNGVEAFKAFEQEHCPLVITDWIMPEMDGLELVRHIREISPQEYVYIIMLTTREGKADLVAGLEAGADDFIRKPFDREELRARVQAGERVVRLERTLSERNRILEENNRRMKHELAMAARLQKALLPTAAPNAPGYHFAWKFHPSEELAGDTLNLFCLDEDALGFYLLDVSGHGLPAALLAVSLSRLLTPMMDQASLLKYRREYPPGYGITPPAEVAVQLNRRFQLDPEFGQYFTLIYGVLTRKTGEIRYVSTGHPGMIHLRRGQPPRILEVSNVPIGILEEFQYQEDTLTLQPGDRLFVYSDGIPEAENPEGEFFGEQRLLESLHESYSEPLEMSLCRLIRRLEDWGQSEKFKDDVSILAIERLPEESTEGKPKGSA